MKKFLSVLLAVCMLFAVCVPAFAVEVKNDATGQPDPADPQKVEVYTDIKDVTSTYTVTIPADLGISWDDKTDHELPYSIESVLLYGAKLSVAVAADDSGKMKLESDDGVTYLYFTLSDNATQEFTGLNDKGTTPTAQPKVRVNAFDQAVAKYTGSVTFTVTYTPPAA